jgi:scytalone dehydratase
MKMTFEIYIPDNLTFQDYIAVVQTARVWADGYDKKVWGKLLCACIRQYSK